ncbi:signal recognition particle protein [Glycomyces xiaoerkulensis]|uniref:signal recognition particle protein n=1 Tax=Glycomyces xiaoerkulensis TaxID=2038139 RepID=UPI000C25FCFA|nr:signal recognition particle protein [Glycomyces xiaoerkulensis]
MFDALSERLSGIFDSLRGKGRLTEADIDATAREIRLALLEADVALPVVKTFISQVKERCKGAEVSKALNPTQQVVKIVNEELVGILGGETRRLNYAKRAPTVIMLAGLQGSGKTTLAGKLAKWLKADGHSPLLVAADLQRPNAVGQLEIVAERAGSAIYAPEPGSGVGDPVKVAGDAIGEAERAGRDVVIIDTAGRLGIDEEMMTQARDIREATDPDEVLFVIDAMVGQDAVNTAEAFRDGVGISGVVLSKLDGDARGGAALSVRHVTGQPILFASTGEKLEDFDVFHPDRMASRILGMGDMLTLIEQAESAFEAEQKEEMTQKILEGEDFTLEDFLEQMQAISKMGPIGNILKMMPGMNQMKDQIESIDDKQIDRTTAIIRSMTPEERRNSKVINGSRRLRIANGSGVTVSEVNQLLTRFKDAQKMMRQMSGAMGVGGGGKATKSNKVKRKGKKGKKKVVRRGGPGGGPAGSPQLPGGMPGGAPGGQMPDLSKLNQDDLPDIDLEEFAKQQKKKR